MSTFYLNFNSISDEIKLNVSDNMDVTKRLFKFDKIASDKDEADIEVELTTEFVEEEVMTEQVCICSLATGGGGDYVETKYFYGEDASIMTVKRWFLEYLEHIENYSYDAFDEELTQNLFNSYLGAVSNIEFNSKITIEDGFYISCYCITRGDLEENDRNDKITFNEIKYSYQRRFQLNKNSFQIFKPMYQLVGPNYCLILINNKYMCFCKFGVDHIYLYGYMKKYTPIREFTNLAEFKHELNTNFLSFKDWSSTRDKIQIIFNEIQEEFGIKYTISMITNFTLLFRYKIRFVDQFLLKERNEKREIQYEMEEEYE